jgi:flavin-dependent dehydrogenase
MAAESRYDVVILGAGLAGLTLTRHLLLDTDRTVLLLERRAEVPPPGQKVGEATVQVSGYYLSKVLDLEEHLLRDHFMKYNLRFYWKPPAGAQGRRDGTEAAGAAIEDYSQAYIRPFSNIASYQLDRNRLEAELLRLARLEPRFAFRAPVAGLEVETASGGADHIVRFEHGGTSHAVAAGWVVDATGRNRLLARRRRLERPSPIHHGAAFAWVEGLIDVERLTGRSRRERRLAPERRSTGHLPVWLATNHFMGEGFWLWVIPLPGKTSLGVVYDAEVFPRERVASPEALVAWICEEFPLFARDLPGRKVLHHGGFRSFAYDTGQAISPERWAVTGEAGRFSDPLYSPGGDLISFHNTLIVDAIESASQAEVAEKTRRYEALLRALYEAYVPSYSVGYGALGDPEVFSLKYAWELAIYFAFYVFPFVNDLFTDRRFVAAFGTLFSRLGPINGGIQRFLADFRSWKLVTGAPRPERPTYFDFTEVSTLAAAEKTFYQVGVGPVEARKVLAAQLANLEELARFVVAHAAAVVLDEPRVRASRGFVEGIDLKALAFDPEGFARRWAACGPDDEPYAWALDPTVFGRFRPAARAAAGKDAASETMDGETVVQEALS